MGVRKTLQINVKLKREIEGDEEKPGAAVYDAGRTAGGCNRSSFPINLKAHNLIEDRERGGKRLRESMECLHLREVQQRQRATAQYKNGQIGRDFHIG